MADGLYRVLPPDALSVIVNTGDDFEHFGLTVCPDLDTVMYTLAGLANPETGWGIDGDTRHAMTQLAAYGDDAWFIIGDRDLATHVRRTRLIRDGLTLTDATRSLVEALGVQARLLPMADRPVSTFVVTASGERLPFQEYFVRRQHRDDVAEVEFAHAQYARVTTACREALESADVVIFCPSNPFLSIAPILEVPMMRAHIVESDAIRIGVSPIVGGAAIKGPAADMMKTLGHECSALGIARLYRDLVEVLYIDEEDRALAPAIRDLGLEVVVAPTVMRSLDDRAALARQILETAAARVGARA
jgi:LPPG:FO 2-phospho-L-lactate transferase